jgi:hypothetical protein
MPGRNRIENLFYFDLTAVPSEFMVDHVGVTFTVPPEPMKRNGDRLMRKMIPTILFSISFFLIPGESSGEDLYHLAISSSNDLQWIENLPIHYFGRVATDTEDFVLIAIDPLKSELLDKIKIPRRKLASTIEEKTLYWIYPNPGKPLSGSLLALEIVRDREGILVHMSPEEAERRAAEGYSIRLLVSLPILYPSTARIALRGVRKDREAAPKPVIQDMVDQVSENKVYSYTGDLTGMWPVTIADAPYTISTRNSYRTDEIQKAGRFLYEFYEKLGLEVSFEEFVYRNTFQRNIVAQKKGSVFPERIIAITSHYDDNPYSVSAPGADDNASGTVGVMLAAEILSRVDFGCTLQFINFAAEEQGLIGSNVHAKKSYCGGEDLEAIINLDMIAWNTAGSLPDMEIHANSMIPASLDLAALFQDIITSYGLGLIPTINKSGSGRSDHASFWGYHFPALMAIESSKDFNPNYHTSGDTLVSFADLNYYLQMVKAGIATVAHLGCLVEEGWGILEGTITRSETGELLPQVSVAIQNPDWGYTLSTASDLNGRYHQRVVAGNHNLTFTLNGCEPKKVSGVSVPKNETVTRDVSLLPGNFYSLIHLPLITRDWAPKQGCP